MVLIFACLRLFERVYLWASVHVCGACVCVWGGDVRMCVYVSVL